MHVILVGKGTGFERAPFKGDGYVTWGVNDVCGYRECDVIFWMDRVWEKDKQIDRTIKCSVNHTNTPMYSTQEWEDIPSGRRYPLEEISEYFGVDFFNDSCCYMLALAIYQGFKEISLFGFNYAWGNMYQEERPGVEFWLGVALARGIIVNIESEYSDLLRSNHQRHAPGMIYAFGTPQKISRRAIKMCNEKATEDKEFLLTVTDRVALIQLLPRIGNYEELKMSKWLNENIWFKADERKKLNLRQTTDDKGMPFYIWDENDIEDMPLKIDIPTQNFIRGILEKINKEKNMHKEHFDLYEKFCLEDK